ncbi:hypothetical protein RZS08_33730, partial [Arthrospira platensis SPKY1]|nr:hypothetical protein [Arthrospira platensis SPKY1]
MDKQGVQVKETGLAGRIKEWFVRDRLTHELLGSGFESREEAQMWVEEHLDETFDDYQILQNDEYNGQTSYDEYTLPGGAGYREILLHLPVTVTVAKREIFSVYDGDQIISQGT